MFRALNFLVPKCTTQICIHSFPAYDDMTRALLDELKEANRKYHIVILTYEKKGPPMWAISPNVIHLKKLSVKGVWAYLRSKYVFFTIGCFSSYKPVKTQICVNVWHGMPIKKIGRYLGPDQQIPFATFGVSSSPFFTKIISNTFSMPPEKILEVGLPRNDVLLKKKNNSLKKNICDKKIVLWLPTYRQSVKGQIRLDGDPEKNVFNMPDLDIDKLNSELDNLGVVVIVKPHPLASVQSMPSVSSNVNSIKIIDNDWLISNNTSLYELLPIADALVTDISSVLVDYLLLDKPIICHFPDENKYRDTRGMIWDFKPTEYGIPIVKTQSDLLVEIAKAMEIKMGYPELKNKMHSQLSGFTKKLLKKIGIQVETNSSQDS